MTDALIPNNNELINSSKKFKNVTIKKIEETDEPESRSSSTFASRPATNKAPAQRSQATFRSSSFKQKLENEDQDQDDGNQNNQVLITELGQSVYDESS
ncbi:hypothetical protein BpHYR1_027426, partial [Brachionus plicatilis]